MDDASRRSAGNGHRLPQYTRVRDQIRRDIVCGNLKGDERLVLAGLCERYGVSMPPIREALNQLQVEGLVVMEPNRGARVREITPDFIKDLFEIRLVLEPALVQRSLPGMTEGDLRDLREIQRHFEGAVARGDRDELILRNDQFHNRIYRINPNNEAVRLLRQHAALIETMRNRFGYHSGRLDQIIYEHQALLRACAGGDTSLARAIATSHIRNSAEDLVIQISG